MEVTRLAFGTGSDGGAVLHSGRITLHPEITTEQTIAERVAQKPCAPN